MSKAVYLQTYGWQMNDGERALFMAALPASSLQPPASAGVA